jgi:predicted NBD/HSP70 family sugar kinase
MRAVVGIDIGGSSQTALAYDPEGLPLARAHLASSARGGDQVMSNILRTLDELGAFEIAALGIGIPGQVDVFSGDVRTAVNLGIGDEPYPLAARLHNELGCPVTIENDVRAAALGLFLEDAPSNPGGSLTLVNIGTGIAAGVVIGGLVVRGSNGMAGEIGHMVMDEAGPLCRCGQTGCLEAIAAGPAIAKAWPDHKTSSSAHGLFAEAARGTPAAVTIASEITRHLVTALTWLAATYDTERVLIGGGVSQAGEPFLHLLRDEIARRATTSEIAARRLRPGQVSLVDPLATPGPKGAFFLAQRKLLQENESKQPTTNKGEAV